MLEQAILDLGRADAIAGRGDDVVLAAQVPEVAVLILPSEIAGQKKSAGEFLFRRVRIFPVFDHGDGIGLTNADDAALSPRQLVSLIVDDAHVETRRRLSHRTRPYRKQFGVIP